MKKQKKYTESVLAQGQCAHEPAVEYQAMRKQSVAPCQYTIEELNAEIDESMAQIARGETIDYKTVIAELRKIVEQ